MPSSPQPSQPPTGPERTGTVFETDDDIQQAVRSNAEVQLVPKSTQPAVKPTTTNVRPYRPTQRPPLALLIALDDGKGDGEVVRLRTDRFVIGRTEGDLLIPHDQQISGRHVEITRQRAEQIRVEVRHLNLSHRGQPLGSISISAGVAVFPRHGMEGADLLRAADRALYQAKSEGRDCVRLAVAENS